MYLQLCIDVCAGVHARESSSDNIDIENVNPQAISGKQHDFPSATVSAAPLSSAAATPHNAPFVPSQALSDTPVLSDASRVSAAAPQVAQSEPTASKPGAQASASAAASDVPLLQAGGSTEEKPFVASQARSDTPVLPVTTEARTGSPVSATAAGKQGSIPSSAGAGVSAPPPAAATLNKPFVSSKVLSEALFGASEEPTSPVSSPHTAQRPTSPFAAQASTAAAAAPTAKPGASNKDVEGVLTEQLRADGTARNSGRAGQIEAALMSSTSPFSRRLSSEEVKPVMARLSQDQARGSSPVKEEEAQTPAEAAVGSVAPAQAGAGVQQGVMPQAGRPAVPAQPTGETALVFYIRYCLTISSYTSQPGTDTSWLSLSNGMSQLPGYSC